MHVCLPRKFSVSTQRSPSTSETCTIYIKARSQLTETVTFVNTFAKKAILPLATAKNDEFRQIPRKMTNSAKFHVRRHFSVLDEEIPQMTKNEVPSDE